jgi:hypothetical protein
MYHPGPPIDEVQRHVDVAGGMVEARHRLADASRQPVFA